MKMYQCRMVQETNLMIYKETIGYIEEKAAKIGLLVEIKGEEGLWKVIAVDNHPIEYYEVKEKQKRDRGGLTSITA